MPTGLDYFCTAVSSVCFNKIPLVSCQPVQSIPMPGQEPFLNRGQESLPQKLPSQRMLLEAGLARSTQKDHCFAKESSISVQHSPRGTSRTQSELLFKACVEFWI